MSLALVTGDEPLSPEAFSLGVARMSASFGVDYNARDPQSGEPTADTLKVRTLYSTIHRLGWTKREFNDRMLQFLATQRWASWTIADFIDHTPPKVYPHSWYLDRLQENRAAAADIGLYWVTDSNAKRGGYVVYGWRREVGDRLPIYDPALYARQIATAPVLPAATPEEPMSAGTRSLLDQAKRIMELEQANEDLRRDRDDLRRRLAGREARVVELEGRVATLQENIRQSEAGIDLLRSYGEVSDDDWAAACKALLAGYDYDTSEMDTDHA